MFCSSTVLILSRTETLSVGPKLFCLCKRFLGTACTAIQICNELIFPSVFPVLAHIYTTLCPRIFTATIIGGQAWVFFSPIAVKNACGSISSFLFSLFVSWLLSTTSYSSFAESKLFLIEMNLWNTASTCGFFKPSRFAFLNLATNFLKKIFWFALVVPFAHIALFLSNGSTFSRMTIFSCNYESTKIQSWLQTEMWRFLNVPVRYNGVFLYRSCLYDAIVSVACDCQCKDKLFLAVDVLVWFPGSATLSHGKTASANYSLHLLSSSLSKLRYCTWR